MTPNLCLTLPHSTSIAATGIIPLDASVFVALGETARVSHYIAMQDGAEDRETLMERWAKSEGFPFRLKGEWVIGWASHYQETFI
jgi:hypothetical protein